MEFTTDLWWEVMNNSRSDDCLVTFEEFMEKIKDMNNDFSYQILRGEGLEITGCLWMTATMRKNIEIIWKLHLCRLHETRYQPNGYAIYGCYHAQ